MCLMFPSQRRLGSKMGSHVYIIRIIYPGLYRHHHQYHQDQTLETTRRHPPSLLHRPILCLGMPLLLRLTHVIRSRRPPINAGNVKFDYGRNHSAHRLHRNCWIRSSLFYHNLLNRAGCPIWNKRAPLWKHEPFTHSRDCSTHATEKLIAGDPGHG